MSDFKIGETNQTPDFLSKFPLGKVGKHAVSVYDLFRSLSSVLCS